MVTSEYLLHFSKHLLLYIENNSLSLDLTHPGIRTSEVVYSVATRDDEATFASYVNSIVLATVYAVNEGITQEHAADMPTITLFGTHVS
jgi:hypothetical protein